jgi:two-component system NtrC family sensor kinase
MYDISTFSLSDMTRCGAALRKLGADARSMEEAAGRIVRCLHEDLRSSSGQRDCVLARTFITVPYAQLPGELQVFASRIVPEIVETPELRCLTLLATAGEEPAWNDRRASLAHQALPLTSAESIARSPMISQLIRQLGVEVGTLLTTSEMIVDNSQHTFNVFHVLDAVGSPHIPAQQQFVIPYGVQSVLGFGGLLPPGELFATILFTRARVPRDVAERFKTLALNVKVALLPFAGVRTFT